MSAPSDPVRHADTEREVERLAAEILDARRRHPVVGLSTRPGEDEPAMEPAQVQRIVGPRARVWVIPTGPSTRALDDLLPPFFGVFGGAVRIWWPGIDRRSDPRDHPRILDRQGVYGNRSYEILRDQARSGGPQRRRGRDDRRAERDPRDDGRRDERRTRDQRPSRDERREGDMRRPGERGERRERRERHAPRRDAERERGLVPDAVLRDRERRHHLAIMAAWLARDNGAGRRAWPLLPLALGEGYVDGLTAFADRVPVESAVTVAARVASGKPGEVNDLDVRADVDDEGTPRARDEDGAAGWTCTVPGADGVRLRWWSRPDGAIELRDLVVDPGAPERGSRSLTVESSASALDDDSPALVDPQS